VVEIKKNQERGKVMKEFKWSGNTEGKCYQCGRAFPTESLEKRANEHVKEFPGFRRAFSGCLEHNHGDIALFEGDCEF
jgi:hypothetical protein